MTVSQAETHYLDYFVIILNIIVILFLVALNGFFVASEFSIVKVRPSRLDTLIKEGSKSAVYARQVTEHLDAYLSVTQLGITLASLGLGWVGGPAVAKMLAPVFALLKLPPQLEHTLAFVVGFSVITALHIVLDGVVAEVIEDLIDDLGDIFKYGCIVDPLLVERSIARDSKVVSFSPIPLGIDSIKGK